MATTMRRATPPIREILRVSRPHQWVKNAAVFAAPAAAGVMLEWSPAWHAFLGMIAFVLASAVTYMINDISDAEADRLHPLKCDRPIAAGDLSPSAARSAAIVLAAAALAISIFAGTWFSITLVAYLLTTTLYSTWLKHIPVVDVITVTTGFALRVVGGALASDSGLSVYLITGVAAAAAFISVGKRAGEVGRLGDSAPDHRSVLRWYTSRRNRTLLFITQAICFGSVVGLALTTMPIWWSAPSIMLSAAILERFRRLVASGHVDDPVRLVTSDRVIMFGAAAFIVLTGSGIYL